MKTIRTLLGLSFILIHSVASAQLENTMFLKQDELPVGDSLSKKLFLQVNHLQYFKNNEYFSPIQVGLTYFGFQLTPSLVYYPNSKTRIEGGLYLRKDYGNTDISDIIPVFTLKFAPDKHNTWILGNLQGSLSHKLIEPLYDFERVIFNRQELGHQHLFKSRWYSHDAWINWEKMLYRGDPFQESVSGGLSSIIHIRKKLQPEEVNHSDFLQTGDTEKMPRRRAYLEFPLQMIANHRGGQIDSTDLPILTMVNYAGGINTGIQFLRKGSFVTDINLQAYYAMYNLLENRPLPYKSGSGYYLNLMVNTKIHQSLMISYWNGSGWMAPRGGTLYQSVSQEGKGYTQKNRELLIVRLLMEKKLFNDFYVGTRLEPYYDLNLKLFEYSHAVYVTYRKAFLLKKDLE